MRIRYKATYLYCTTLYICSSLSVGIESHVAFKVMLLLCKWLNGTPTHGHKENIFSCLTRYTQSTNYSIKERALDVGGPVRSDVPSPALLRVIREQSMNEGTELIFVPIDRHICSLQRILMIHFICRLLISSYTNVLHFSL